MAGWAASDGRGTSWAGLAKHGQLDPPGSPLDLGFKLKEFSGESLGSGLKYLGIHIEVPLLWEKTILTKSC